MATVLNAIYDEDFLALSYGFRRGEERTPREVPTNSFIAVFDVSLTAPRRWL